MLGATTKKQIRDIHISISENLPDFKPRKSQNYLVAEIAKTLAGDYHTSQRICVLEAGTGTGKSLAYCLGTIPYALQKKKKVVISTATVALQEQLMGKELPFFKQHSGLKFKFDLVKGRGRYVCLQKLAALLTDNQDSFEAVPLLESPLTENDKRTLNELMSAYKSQKWKGDRDSWPEAIEDQLWQLISSDKHACQRQMSGHKCCPFHLCRDQLDKMDVLVVNHSLLLADLDLGGGKILPEPADCIYVLDEAHHLPHVTRDFSSSTANIHGTLEWLEKLVKFGSKLAKTIKSPSATGESFKLADAIRDCQLDLKKVLSFFLSLISVTQKTTYIDSKTDSCRSTFNY